MQESSSSDPLVTRVAACLAFIAVAFLWFAHEAQAPWEGKALSRMAKRLDVPKEDVPWQVFFDFETLGGHSLGLEVYRQIGLWQGAVFVGLSLGMAALTARWWVPLTRRRPRAGPLVLTDDTVSTDDPSQEKSFHPGRAGWICLAAVLLLAAIVRAPHLDRAIYFDEQDNLRRNFHGFVEIEPDGTKEWHEAGLSEALWENRLGNNPVLFSVTAQASLGTWRLISGAERDRFHIVALRLPVFVAGVASIAALWWLLQLWGLRMAAAISGVLAAIHPMHIDYSLQARGYAFVLLFVPLALGFAWLAIRRNSWRYWYGFAFCVFFSLWSYAGSVYFALALNAGLLFYLVAKAIRSGDKGWLGPISRLLAVNATTGLLYVFLIAPHLPQVSYHFRQIFEMIPLEAFWLFYAWSHYSTGTNFPSAGDIQDLRTDEAGLWEVLLQRFAGNEPVLVFLQWLVIPALIGCAFVCLLRKSGREGIAPSLLLFGLGFLAPVLALIHQHFTSLYFYYWYLSYALPLVIAGIAIGLAYVIQQLLKKEKPFHRAIAYGLPIIFLVIFFWQVTPREGGRSGRIKRDKEWQLNEEGVLAIEFQRGRSHWITTEDGRSICQLEVYEADGKRRAGR